MSARPSSKAPVLRRARPADADPVWHCRQALRGSAAIQSVAARDDFEAHIAWFSRAIADAARLFFIIELNGKWLGYLRFDPLDAPKGHRVSIALMADGRGTGVGGEALMQGCAIAEQAGFSPLFADISQTNPASRRIFERCGFVPFEHSVSADGFQRFVRHPQAFPPIPSTL